MEQESKDAPLSPEMHTLVFLSPNLVTEVKSVNFGWQNSDTYVNYHRDKSPFAMPNMSFEFHLAAVNLEVSLDRATSTTLADPRTTETGPPLCPQDYVGFLQMLGAYIKLIFVLFGLQCSHLLQVVRINALLHSQIQVYYQMQRDQIAHILWTHCTATQWEIHQTCS